MSAEARILVLGASGMLGHKLAQVAAGRGFSVAGSIRDGGERVAAVLPDSVQLIEGVAVERAAAWNEALDRAEPDLVVNCIGAVKQRAAGRDPVEAIRLNALFPHQLAGACAGRGTRLIHVSTDCVFSGRRGAYDERSEPDPVDLYGRSKLLGEPRGPGVLTIRTSFVGRELAGSSGLVEWLIGSVGGDVRGFADAVFSGLTAQALSEVICELAGADWPGDGLLHVGGEPIDKYAFLCGIRDAFGLAVGIEADRSVQIDRSLDSGRLRHLLGWTPPSWAEMLAEMARDPTPYPSGVTIASEIE